MNTLTTDLLEIRYETGGTQDGPPVLLLHGWPDDVRGWRGVVPHLNHDGPRWVAPWLRGFGPTLFRSVDTIRDGSAVALVQDAIDLADYLGWTKSQSWDIIWARELCTPWPLFFPRVFRPSPRLLFPIRQVVDSRLPRSSNPATGGISGS